MHGSLVPLMVSLSRPLDCPSTCPVNGVAQTHINVHCLACVEHPTIHLSFYTQQPPSLNGQVQVYPSCCTWHAIVRFMHACISPSFTRTACTRTLNPAAAVVSGASGCQKPFKTASYMPSVPYHVVVNSSSSRPDTALCFGPAHVLVPCTTLQNRHIKNVHGSRSCILACTNMQQGL